jgi:Ca2+/H+ antiporter, TMEM165/GDT1 family
MRHFNGRRMILFPLFGLAALVLFPYVIMLLWNALLPGIFHFPEINFWQALGILVLSRILFGGFRGGHFGHRHGGCHGQYNHMGPWGRRWSNMTEEERAKMKEEFQKRCRHHGYDHVHDEDEKTKA